MAANTSDYVQFVQEQLAALRGIVSGRFFGGVGLSLDSVQFAMIIGNALYFVVDDSTRPKYEKLGSRCFSYQTKKKRVAVKRYYEVPGALLEEQDELLALAREAIGVASNAALAKKSAAAVKKKSKQKN